MDVEGAEWDALKQLLNNENDMAKLRTLNFEIHFNMGENNRRARESLTELVGIMEKLSKRFAVTGSTIELLHRANLKNFAAGKLDEKHSALIYSKQGIPLDQYC